MEKYITPKNHSIAKFYKLLNKESTIGSEIIEALNKGKSIAKALFSKEEIQGFKDLANEIYN